MLETLTFEQLPFAVTKLIQEISSLKQLVLDNGESKSAQEKDELLTIQKAADFLNLSVPTIYSKVSKGELPVMKRSKRLYFSKLELTDYLKTGRRKTNEEIAEAASKFLLNKKGLNNDK